MSNLQRIEICLLSDNIQDYHVVAQGKTSIPGVDDAEELGFTDVRWLIEIEIALTQTNNQ